MKNILIALAIAIGLSGCYKQAESVNMNGNGFEVEKLFTEDDCTVYRFSDGGYAHYFTNCRGVTMSVQHSGKTAHPEEISGGE